MSGFFGILWVIACAVDADGDWFPASEEAAVGTDDRLADTDGDGLDDLTEVRWTFTDPLAADSDGDGDGDGFEVDYGLDPLNPASHKYLGPWPMALATVKDAIIPPPSGTRMAVGNVMPRFMLAGPLGETVDAYDFARHGKPLLLGGGTTDIGDLAHQWIVDRVEFNAVPSAAIIGAVDSGALQFAAFVSSDSVADGVQPPQGPDAWCPDEPRLCLAEQSMAMWSWTDQFDGNQWLLLDENMVVRAVAQGPGSDMDFTTLEAVLFTLLDAP